MDWHVPVLYRIVVGYILAPPVRKSIVVLGSRTRRLLWQFYFAMILAVSAAIIAGTPLADLRLAIVFGIGIINAFACYCEWRACAISMSKQAVFTQGDDLIAMGLACVFLNETAVVTAPLCIGIGMCLLAAVAFALEQSRKAREALGRAYNAAPIGLWIAVYSVIWGGAAFSKRYFALDHMPLLAYIAAWYSGSVIGASIVFMIGGKKEAGLPLESRHIAKVAVLSVLIWLSLMGDYWASQKAPIVITQPIFQVCEVVFPSLWGLLYFKEGTGLSRIEKFALFLGLGGGILTGISYHG